MRREARAMNAISRALLVGSVISIALAIGSIVNGFRIASREDQAVASAAPSSPTSGKQVDPSDFNRTKSTPNSKKDRESSDFILQEDDPFTIEMSIL